MSLLEEVEKPYNEVEHVGLTIRTTDTGLHSGILYLDSKNNPRHLHLAFHFALRDEEIGHPYRWCQIGIDRDNKAVLAALVSRIASADSQIPYGFDSDGVCFNLDGSLIAPPCGKGLTCATFIVAVFRLFGFDLIDLSSWPDRDEDIEFQKEIISLLEDHASADHVEAVMMDLGAKRTRPDEVVASATRDSVDWPVAFETARELANQIILDLS